MTLKDIAHCVTRDGAPSFSHSPEGIAKNMRRIRHWTQNDLLKPYGKKATGKGIPRFYVEEPTLQIAGVLEELSRFSAALEVLKPVADELYEGWEGGSPYLYSAMTDLDVFLQVSWHSDPHTAEISGASIILWDAMDDPPNQKPDPRPASSVLINMSQVTERVFSNLRAYTSDEDDA